MARSRARSAAARDRVSGAPVVRHRLQRRAAAVRRRARPPRDLAVRSTARASSPPRLPATATPAAAPSADEPLRLAATRRRSTPRAPTRCSTPPAGGAAPTARRAAQWRSRSPSSCSPSAAATTRSSSSCRPTSPRIGMRVRDPPARARHPFSPRRARRPRSFDVLFAGIPGDVSLVVSLGDVRFALRRRRARLRRLPRAARSTRCSPPRARRPTRRARARLARVQRALDARMPVAWIYHARGVQGVSRRLRGVTMDLRGELVTVAAWIAHAGRPHRRRDDSSRTQASCPIAATHRRGRARAARRFARRRPRARAARGARHLRARRRCSRATAAAARATARCSSSIRSRRTRIAVRRAARCYAGERHDRLWLMFAQLWLAERAVHGAAALRAARRAARSPRFARATLDEYADRYARYPNRDNVLGPSRPFFSTYLESIWLLQLCVAADLLDAARRWRCGDRRASASASSSRAPRSSRVRRRRIEPPGLERRRAARRRARARRSRARRNTRCIRASGLIAQLGTGLLADGSWYEGENYHLFAHRGLWYGVTMAEAAGLELPAALLDALPGRLLDAVSHRVSRPHFPARRDSQYGVSLRQWRIAESCELGLARARRCATHRRARVALRATTFRIATPAAGARRPRPSATSRRPRLSRADLGWRSLLFAREALPAARSRDAVPSALLEGQGIAVFRRDARRRRTPRSTTGITAADTAIPIG